MQILFTDSPSATVQYFPRVPIKIYCYRYWWLKNWEYSTFSFSSWQIYHSTGVGSVIGYRSTTYHMETNGVYLIAPNTDYSSRIEGSSIPCRGDCLCGGNLDALAEGEREQLLANGAIRCLFVHFSLGFPYDNVLKGVFPVDLTESPEAKIDYMQHCLLSNGQISTSGIGAFLNVQALICEILLGVKGSQWKPNTGDVRTTQAINYVEDHYEEDLLNELLASRICMATSPFSRPFKSETGVTLQKFVKKKRIDYACIPITYTGISVEEIAAETGFSNRSHFTRVFCETMKVAPGECQDLFLFLPA